MAKIIYKFIHDFHKIHEYGFHHDGGSNKLYRENGTGFANSLPETTTVHRFRLRTSTDNHTPLDTNSTNFEFSLFGLPLTLAKKRKR